MLAKLIGSVIALVLAAAPPSVEAQASGKVHRVGLLAGGSAAATAFVRTAIVEGLHELGYREGQTVILFERYADGTFERLQQLAAELVRLKVDVILTSTTPATLAAKGATPTIPIVVVTSGDLVGSGVVINLARPGGNVTGLSFLGTELAVKRTDLLKQVAPTIRKLVFLGNRAIRAVKIVTEAARSLGVEVQVVAARGPEQFEPAFRAMNQARADALLVQLDPSFSGHLARLADLAIRHRLPTMCGAGYANAGGLMSCSVSRADTVRQAAGYVDRILRGAKPAELPVEQPTKFELAINLKTAKVLGVTIPPSVLLQAEQVVE